MDEDVDDADNEDEEERNELSCTLLLQTVPYAVFVALSCHDITTGPRTASANTGPSRSAMLVNSPAECCR